MVGTLSVAAHTGALSDHEDTLQDYIGVRMSQAASGVMLKCTEGVLFVIKYSGRILKETFDEDLSVYVKAYQRARRELVGVDMPARSYDSIMAGLTKHLDALPLESEGD